MDAFTGLTRALGYIEAHLSDELDYNAAAREAAMSPYQFQRVFGVLCGCPLGEYVRKRRLTLAGAELAAGGARQSGELCPRVFALSRRFTLAGSMRRTAARLLPRVRQTDYGRRSDYGLQH